MKYIAILIVVIIALMLIGYLNITENVLTVDSTNVESTVQVPEPDKWKDDEVTIAWLGHASFLINFYGTRILIDPVLEDKIGITPFGNYTLGPRRIQPPALRAEQIGDVDLLLISHLHTDHFDYPTLRKIQFKDTIAVTPKNSISFWKGLRFGSIIEMHWGDVKTIKEITIKAIEGKHWGARMPWQKGLEANSYLISKNGVNIFFGGDTAYTPKIRKQLEGISIDVAIIGISCYSPKSFEERHATPEQAWKMAEEMKAKWVIPMHWGAFKLSQEPMNEPMVRFLKAAQNSLDKIAIKEVGATWVMPK